MASGPGQFCWPRRAGGGQLSRREAVGAYIFAMPYFTLDNDPRVADALVCIGAAVRSARFARQLSQIRLELLTDIDQTTISRIENGRAPNVRLEYLARIIAVIGPLPAIERATRPLATGPLLAPWQQPFIEDDPDPDG